MATGDLTVRLSDYGPGLCGCQRGFGAPRLEDPNRVAQVPALASILQHAALAADFGQCFMAAWADGLDLTAPGGGFVVLAVLDGKGEGRGRGAAAQCTGVHDQSVGSGTPVIEWGGDTKID